MFSKHTGGKIPWIFWIERVTNDDLPGSIGPPLLEMVTLCDLFAVVTGSAGLFGAVRIFAIDGERAAIESPNRYLLVLKALRGKGYGKEEG